MSNEELKKELDKTTAALIGISKDVRSTETLIDKLMSLKGQLDIEPTLLNIEVKDVIKECDFDAYKIISTKKGILYKTYGGYSVFVKPQMSTLYKHLTNIMELEDNKDSLDEQSEVNLSVLIYITSMIIHVPLYAFSKDEWMFEIFDCVKGVLEKSIKESLDAPLEDEDHEANAEYKEKVEFAEQLKKDMEEVDE